MPYALNVINVNDQLIECVLDGTTFSISLTWNETAQAFYVGLQNSDGETILAGVKAVANYPLFFQYRAPFMPLGDVIISLSEARERIERTSFADGLAQLVYITEGDLAELGVLERYGKI